MKTAMQELIELLELNDKNEPMPFLIDSIKEVYMSKEKDQIIDAYNQGTLDGESSMLVYPNYYNQNYGE